MKSKWYIKIRDCLLGFAEYCRREENIRISAGAIGLVVLLTGIQIGEYLSEQKSYVYNDKGELVAFVRNSEDTAESIPLRIRISRNGESKVKDVVINMDGKKKNGSVKDASDDENKFFETYITGIVSELSGSKDKILYLPLRDKDVSISWEKQSDFSFILIPLLFPLIMAAIRESRKSDDKKKQEYRNGCVKRSLPRFCNQLLLITGSGIILEDAFNRIAMMYENSSSEDYFKNIIIGIKNQCENTSDNTINALVNKSKELRIRELSRLSGILENGQKKGIDMTSKLELESELLWNERKNHAEEKGRAAEVKLSFPLAILLIVLIVITAAPAMMEM
ncbi:MAG: hypothetical protein ACI4LC_07340 [Emergencia sp.]